MYSSMILTFVPEAWMRLGCAMSFGISRYFLLCHAFHQKCTPVKSRAEAGKADRHSGAEAMILKPFSGGDQHGCRRCVAVAANVGKKLALGNSEGLGYACNQVLICLVHEERIDVGRVAIVACEQGFDDAGN